MAMKVAILLILLILFDRQLQSNAVPWKNIPKNMQAVGGNKEDTKLIINRRVKRSGPRVENCKTVIIEKTTLKLRCKKVVTFNMCKMEPAIERKVLQKCFS